MEKTQEVYLDSNVFIYSMVSESDLGQYCRELLKKVLEGEIIAYTSVLTFDEVFWKVKKLSNKEKAISTTQSMLLMPNLNFLDTNMNTVLGAHRLIREYDLDPRDAIHAATCKLNDIQTIISEDLHFDKLDFLKRKPIK